MNEELCLTSILNHAKCLQACLPEGYYQMIIIDMVFSMPTFGGDSGVEINRRRYVLYSHHRIHYVLFFVCNIAGLFLIPRAIYDLYG